MNMLPRIIINADDFGISEAVNSEIVRFVERGLVTSATVLANGPAFHEAVRMAKSCPQASFGVHLNHTEFAPVIKRGFPKKLYDAKGELNIRFEQVVNCWDLKYVIEEWSAQLRTAQDAGLAICHLDSHHHVHTLPSMFPALKRLQGAFGIKRVRTTRNIIPVALERGVSRQAKIIAKNLWHCGLKYIPPLAKTTDLFGSVTDFVFLAKEVPVDFWANKSIELMCHPGHDDTKFRRECAWLEQGLSRVVGFDFDAISFQEI